MDSEDSQVAEITAVDAGILALKTAVEKLHLQVDRLQHSIEEYGTFLFLGFCLLIDRLFLLDVLLKFRLHCVSSGKRLR